MSAAEVTTVSAAVRAFREDCARIRAEAERALPRRCHIVGRGVELIAIDETGERNDDLGGPDYLTAKELTIKTLTQTAKHWAKYYSPQPAERGGHRLVAVHLAGGFDVYDSFSDYMAAMRGDGLDYDIYDEWAGQDVPLSLLTD
jgi:hypothetical protein